MAKKFAKKFYNSKAWKECRGSYIKSVHGLCERCGQPGYIVHHKEKLTPGNISNPYVALNHKNLEYLCLDCHNKEHEFEREHQMCTKKGLRFNKSGELVKNEGE